MHNYMITFGFLLLSFTVFGWFMNIIEIVNSSFDPITGILVVRIIGVFLFPLGGVMGYF